MKTWKVELTAGGKSLAEEKIQRGVYQRDALSPLWFIISMMPLNHILRKCTVGYKFRTLREKETYKYWAILEADTIKQVEMKEKIKSENQKATWDKTM